MHRWNRSVAPPTSTPVQFDQQMKLSEGQNAIQSFSTLSAACGFDNAPASRRGRDSHPGWTSLLAGERLMAELKIIRAEEVEPQDMRGGKDVGQVKRILASEKFFFNIDEVHPGHSPHHWHRHVKYRTETHEVDYPADFEELYFIISGHGVIQWKTDSGETREQKVGPGDTIFMLAD